MKIAVQFYGHSRSFRETSVNFIKNVVEVNERHGFQVDTFIHTWDECEHSTIKKHYKKDHELVGKKLSNDDVDFIKTTYKPVSLLIEPQIELNADQLAFIKKNNYPLETYKITNNISYTIYKVNKLRQEINVDYDLVITTRLDINFLKPFSLQGIFDQSTPHFMRHSPEQLERTVFYSYCSNIPNLVRDQNKYITGIDLLMMSKPVAMDAICGWHNEVLSRAPEGTECALTRRIVENKFRYQLMHYDKPECWTILRTNEPASKKNAARDDKLEKQINFQFSNWRFEAVKQEYEQSLLSNNLFLARYIRFLADTGQLDILDKLMVRYGFDYLKDYSAHHCPDKELRPVVLGMINFYENFYIPAKQSSLGPTPDVIVSILTLCLKEDLRDLVHYLNANAPIVEREDARMHMVLNFAINRLIESGLLSEDISINFINSYSGNKAINRTRKCYVLRNIVGYFIDRGNLSFFKFLGKEKRYIHNLYSTLHRIGGTEPGCVNLRRSLNEMTRIGSISFQTKKSSPKVAIALSGMIRGNDLAVFDKLKQNIIDPLQASVFVHTWDVRHDWMGLGGDVNWVYRLLGKPGLDVCPKELLKKTGLKKYFPATYEKLSIPTQTKMTENYIYKNFTAANCIVESENKFLEQIKCDTTKFQSRGNLNQAKMFYGIYRSIKLIEDYEKSTGIEFDYIIRCRPDIAVMDRIDIGQLMSMNENELLVDFYPYGPQDQFWAADRNTAYKLSKLWLASEETERLSPFIEYQSIDSHDLWFLWLIYNNIVTKESKLRRDVSLAVRTGELPNLKDELQTDLEKLPSDCKTREDFLQFFRFLLSKAGMPKSELRVAV